MSEVSRIRFCLWPLAPSLYKSQLVQDVASASNANVRQGIKPVMLRDFYLARKQSL
jgi:hypothetical protein